MAGINKISQNFRQSTVQFKNSSHKDSSTNLVNAMRLLLVVFLVPFASGRQSSYGVDEDILDEVFDQLQYDDNYDYDVAVEDVNYDYAYEDEDQATIPGKAGRDYPISVIETFITIKI